MDFNALRRRYVELRGELEAAKIDEKTFQKAIDGLQTEDEWGRFWMLGAQTGDWYYHNGQEWVQADPADSHKLPFVDEQGRYWMLGARSGQWFYYDGDREEWISSGSGASEAPPDRQSLPASPDAAETQYYQDDQGRYWTIGAKSGEWYFYDDAGWHRASELADQSPPATPPPGPAPSQQPAGYPAPGQSYYPGTAAGQPYSGPAEAGFPPYQSTSRSFSSSGRTGAPSPDVPPNIQVHTSPPVQQEQPPADKPEPGVWYYFDGERWLRYEGLEEAAEKDEVAAAGEMPGAQTAQDYAGDELDLDVADVDFDFDVEEGIEVVELSADDIVEMDRGLVEAEVEVEVLKPGQEPVLGETKPVEPVTTTSTGSPPPAATVDRQSDTLQMAPQKVMPTGVEIQPPPGASAAEVRRPARPQRRKVAREGGFSSLLWTAVGGVAVLILAFLVIVAARFALDNQAQRQSAVAVQPSPTLDAGPPPSTPTPAPTPTETATPPPTATPVPLAAYSNSALGFALDYPEGWLNAEGISHAAFGPSARALEIDDVRGALLWVALTEEGSPTLESLLADGLARLPSATETLTEGTVSIGDATWTSAQIRFEAPNLDGEAIASLAVTERDGFGYTIIAVAPAEAWNDFSPLFQSAINSFRFVNLEVADSELPVGNTPTATATATLEPTPEPVVYQVVAGDTLLGIAFRFDVEVEDIMAANGLSDAGLLRIGQELVIPLDGQAIAAAPTTTPTRDTTATAAEELTPTVPAATAETPSTPTPAPTTPVVVEPTATSTVAAEAVLSGRIAYPAWSADIDGFNIWVAGVNGSEQTIIVGSASQPAFSADGGLLAYRSWDPQRRGLHFIDFVGGRQGRMASFLEDALPSWAPDNNTVAFVTRREGDRVPRVYRVGQLGGDDRSLGFQAEHVDTLPDGRLVVRGCSISGDCGMWVMLPDGGGEVKIASDGSDTAPAANPVTGKIVFMSFNRGGGGNWEIWSMNNDGSDVRRLTNDPANDGLPTWSPDGLSIAFVSDRGGTWAVWAMNADGSNQRKLFDMRGSPDGVVLHDTPNSRGWLEERITWAP